jgi:hypothetical protein
MYEPYRASLMSIWGELSRAAQKHPALYHQRFLVPAFGGPSLISEDSFRQFVRAYTRSPANEWCAWERTPDGSYWGRFHGAGDGLEEFERLAESAYLVLRELDEALPDDHGYHGWLNILHDMAHDQPTPLLRSRRGVWGLDAEPQDQEFSEVVDQWVTESDGEIEFPPHPVVNTLAHNVFTASMSAIELILDPEKAFLVGDWLDDFPLVLRPAVQEPAAEPSLDAGQRRASDDRQPAAAAQFEKPQIDISFDGATWKFWYSFAGVEERGDYTVDMLGFHLYEAILESDGQGALTSIKFWEAAGLHRPAVLLASTGTVDGDSDQRRIANAADEEQAIGLEGIGGDDQIDEDGLVAVRKKLDSLTVEMERCANSERRAEIEQEIITIKSWVSRCLDHRGRSRKLVASDEDRARKRITNRLKDARNLISKSMPTFAHYLLTTVRNDGGWSYDSRRASALIARAKR